MERSGSSSVFLKVQQYRGKNGRNSLTCSRAEYVVPSKLRRTVELYVMPAAKVG